jgi:hypothetical protein
VHIGCNGVGDHSLVSAADVIADTRRADQSIVAPMGTP